MRVIDETRFCKPDNLCFDSFTNKRGGSIRTARADIPNARGTILLLTGLSEFTEKYFETIRELNAFGFSVVTFDWASQGGSYRTHPSRPTMIYIDSFDDYLSDLDQFINRELSNTSFFILAHSMGGHLALRYTLSHTLPTLKGIILSAPMVMIRTAEILPRFIVSPLLKILKKFPLSFVPAGLDWSPYATPRLSGTPALTSDPHRAFIQHNWMHEVPALRLGSPSNQWLLAALHSCACLSNELCSYKITVPLLVCLAGDDSVVSSPSARAALASQGRIVEIAGAKHEILMERDELRRMFFENIYPFLETNL